MRDPAPTRWRLAGFAATGLMAAGAFHVGALPGTVPPTGGPGPLTGSCLYWLALAVWFAGLSLLAVAWWRIGTAVLTAPNSWPGTRWLIGTGALWALPLLLAPPVASRDVYSYACQGSLWIDGVDPYRVGVAPGGCPWADAVPPLWRETATPYGPLAVALAGGAVAVALLRLVALAGGLLVAGYAPALARAGGLDPAAATWLGLLSPLVLIHLVGGAHNDAVMVGLVLAALTVAARGFRPDAAPALFAGSALGLAAAIKITALVAAPFVILLAATRPPAADRTRISTTLPTALAVLTTGTAVFGALTLLTGLDLGWVHGLPETGRLVQWTSLPTGVGMTAGYALRLAGHPEAFGTAVAVARLAGSAALLAAVAALTAHGWRTGGPTQTHKTAVRRVVMLCGTAFAVLALLSPVFYPWYALVALAVLAAGVADRRWWLRLAATAIGLSLLVLPDGLGLAVLTKLPGALLVTLGLGTALALTTRRLTRSPTRARSPAPHPGGPPGGGGDPRRDQA